MEVAGDTGQTEAFREWCQIWCQAWVFKNKVRRMLPLEKAVDIAWSICWFFCHNVFNFSGRSVVVVRILARQPILARKPLFDLFFVTFHCHFERTRNTFHRKIVFSVTIFKLRNDMGALTVEYALPVSKERFVVVCGIIIFGRMSRLPDRVFVTIL